MKVEMSASHTGDVSGSVTFGLIAGDTAIPVTIAIPVELRNTFTKLCTDLEGWLSTNEDFFTNTALAKDSPLVVEFEETATPLVTEKD